MYTKLKELIFKILALKNAKHFEAEYSGIVNLGVFFADTDFNKGMLQLPMSAIRGRQSSPLIFISRTRVAGSQGLFSRLKTGKTSLDRINVC